MQEGSGCCQCICTVLQAVHRGRLPHPLGRASFLTGLASDISDQAQLVTTVDEVLTRLVAWHWHQQHNNTSLCSCLACSSDLLLTYASLLQAVVHVLLFSLHARILVALPCCTPYNTFSG